MAEDEVVIQIRAELNNTRQQLDQLNADLKSIGTTGTGAATQTRTAWQGLKASFTEINSAINLLQRGFQGVERVYGAVITDTVAYNKQIRDLAQNLGITTEETSRIVQAMDDFGIEAGAVESALQMMTKRGVAPSIDELARLADQYNSISDPVERAALMSEKLGRNWTALTPALKMGGDAIRAQAASIEKNLIVTEQASAASREYEKAVDNLTDAWTGFKVEVGNGVIPVLTKVINLSMDAGGTLRDESADAVEAAKSYKEYREALQKTANAAGLVIQANGNLTTANGTLVQSNFAVSESLWEVIQAAKSVPPDMAERLKLDEIKNKGQEAAGAINSVTYAIKDMTTAQIGQQMLQDLEAARNKKDENGNPLISSEQYKKAFEEIATGYLGIDRTQVKFSEDMSQLTQDLLDGKISWNDYAEAMKNAKDAVDAYNSTKPPQAGTPEGNTPGRLLTKGEPLKHEGSIQDATAAHAGSLQDAAKASGDLAQNQEAMVAQASALADALPMVDRGMQNVTGAEDKLSSSATVAATEMTKVSDSMANGRTQVDLYIPKLLELQGVIDSMHGKNLAVTVSVGGVSGSAGGSVGGSSDSGTTSLGGGASGLDTIVPPGYNENALYAASSGERVKIMKPGDPDFNAGRNGGNITIYGRTTIITGQNNRTNKRAELRSARVN